MRVPQQDRSLATRAKVLDAAVECLVELGYANTTTGLVADRAGVSRGAMQYHFRTKSDLLAAAFEHLADQIGAGIRKAAASLPPDLGEDRITAAIDVLWASSSGPLFSAWLELNVAGRTDPELQDMLAELTERTSLAIVKQASELFGLDPDDAATEAFIDLNVAMLLGVLLARHSGIGVGSRRTRRAGQLLATWKAAAPVVLEKSLSPSRTR